MLSMTGYSKLFEETDEYKINLEIKSVNGKGLYIKTKLPSFLNFLEGSLNTIIGKKISRGNINLKVEFYDKKEYEDIFTLNEEFVSSYLNILEKFENKYNISISKKEKYIINNPNFLEKNSEEIDESYYEKIIFDKLDSLINSIVESKKEEGSRLQEVILGYLSNIKNNLEKIIEMKEEPVINYREKLLKRLNEIREDINFKEEDIIKELYLFTDKVDISEEIDRLKSHIESFETLINSSENSIGRKLDFILQEMFRELNTMGIKSNYYNISKLVLDSKNDVERIREQAMNVE